MAASLSSSIPEIKLETQNTTDTRILTEHGTTKRFCCFDKPQPAAPISNSNTGQKISGVFTDKTLNKLTLPTVKPLSPLQPSIYKETSTLANFSDNGLKQAVLTPIPSPDIVLLSPHVVSSKSVTHFKASIPATISPTLSTTVTYNQFSLISAKDILKEPPYSSEISPPCSKTSSILPTSSPTASSCTGNSSQIFIIKESEPSQTSATLPPSVIQSTVIQRKSESNSHSFRGSEEDCPINTSVFNSTGPLCRICHETDSNEDLISPCCCLGTMKLVHKSCIERWLTLTQNTTCEVCNYAFEVIRKPPPIYKIFLNKERTEERRTILGDICCFLVLTPLTFASVYICIYTAFYSFNTKNEISNEQKTTVYARKNTGASKTVMKSSLFITEWQPTGLMILAVILMCIYSVWATITVRYHVPLLKRWRDSHCQIQLDTRRKIKPSNETKRDFSSISSFCSLDRPSQSRVSESRFSRNSYQRMIEEGSHEYLSSPEDENDYSFSIRQHRDSLSENYKADDSSDITHL